MRGQCNMTLDFFTANEGFSFDELVLRINELFKGPNGLAQIASVIVGLLQEVMVSRLAKSRSLPHIQCCDAPHLCVHDHRNRSFKCSIGTVRLSLHRVRCKNCGRKSLLLGNWLRFPAPNSRKSNEFEKIVIEAATGTSYRRASVQLVREHLPCVPKSTMNDWLLRTGCDELSFDSPHHKSPMQVYADGTYVKGPGKNGKAVKRDVKVAFGVNRENQVFPIGTYTGKTWQEIAEEWRTQKINFPEGSVLIADGEVGLAESLAGYVSDIQRCQWHIDHDLYHMCRLDGKLNSFSAPIRKELRHVMGIELPEEDYSPVPDEQREVIKSDLKQAEAKVDALISRMQSAGCTVAARYLEKAKHGMFGYVRRWLRFGIVCPKASSMVERVMRELGRRLKRIAYGWSPKGAEKMSRIILKRFTQPKEWEAYWKRITDTLVPRFWIRFDGRIKADSPEFS